MSTETNSTTDTAKYDRQLRLWGEEGQAKLESAHICLINGTATGTETLKNLVLPGIGYFTVVDGGKVTEADTGNNFFVTLDKVGQSRAKVVSDLLWELNPLVKGATPLEKDPIALLNNEPDFFKKFTVILSTGLPESANRKLAKLCYENNIPLFILKSYGFIGYMRVVLAEHTVVETKPDNPFQDLRIVDPFPELVEFVNGIDMDALKADTASARYGHIPLIVVLIKSLDHWKATHDGKGPTTRQDKDQFKKYLYSLARNDKEDNFPQAVELAYKAWTPTPLPYDTNSILNDNAANNLTSTSSNFWIIANAVKQFVDENKILPLVGTIPDMTSDTQTFIALQNVYQAKATQQAQNVYAKVQASLTKLGRDVNSISYDEVKNFCKNAHSLLVVRTSSLEHELDPASNAALEAKLEDPTSNVMVYAGLRGVDQFYEKHGRFPGSSDNSIEQDADELTSIIHAILPTPTANDWAAELTRFGGAELHNIAAFLGGIAAQEVIKAITHLYAPVNNTFLFNGMNTTSSSLKL